MDKPPAEDRMNAPDELLASRRETWNSLGRLTVWGTAEALLLTLIAVLHAVQGPSWGLLVLSLFLQAALLLALLILRR